VTSREDEVRKLETVIACFPSLIERRRRWRTVSSRRSYSDGGRYGDGELGQARRFGVGDAKNDCGISNV